MKKLKNPALFILIPIMNNELQSRQTQLSCLSDSNSAENYPDPIDEDDDSGQGERPIPQDESSGQGEKPIPQDESGGQGERPIPQDESGGQGERPIPQDESSGQDEKPGSSKSKS